MHIDDDHRHHGAALIQIAEHPLFTAINSFKLTSGVSRSACRINDTIGIYLKYASAPLGRHKEYGFTFHEEHLDELEQISQTVKTYMALVCVEDRHICCLAYSDLTGLIERRVAARGAKETQYVVLVTAPKNKKFRVYINAPGVRNTMLGKPLKVGRSDFPKLIFS